MNVKYLVMALTTTLLLSGCDNEDKSAETSTPLRLVKTYTIDMPVEAQWKEFPGVVDANQTADIGFRVAGKLIRMHVGEGDPVKTSQLLAKLDDTDYQAQLRSRQAEYQQANNDYKRAQTLAKSGAISKSDFNKLEAQNATAEAALFVARQNLAYTELRAPFSGQIARRHVNNFEEVSALQTVFTLQDLSSLAVRANIPERVMINASRDSQPTIEAVFDSIPDQAFPLTVSEVSTVADSGSNTYQVTFAMQKVEGRNILPGMSVTIKALPDASRQSGAAVFSIPAQAVLERDDGRFVYLAVPTSGGQARIERRLVQTGKLTRSGLLILGGLNIGDRVVVAGMSKMREGLDVRLAEE